MLPRKVASRVERRVKLIMKVMVSGQRLSWPSKIIQSLVSNLPSNGIWIVDGYLCSAKLPSVRRIDRWVVTSYSDER